MQLLLIRRILYPYGVPGPRGGGVKAHAALSFTTTTAASVTERALTGASTSEATTTIATNEET